MADMAPRSEGFCTETLLIQPRLGDVESVEEVRKPHIALADCANLLVRRAIVGRHDSSDKCNLMFVGCPTYSNSGVRRDSAIRVGKCD